MRRHCASLFWVLLAMTNSACAQAKAPADVAAFIERRDECDHLRGELPDPEEQERLAAVISEINRDCEGTDAALQHLKKKYANSAAVLNELDRYETDIEAR